MRASRFEHFQISDSLGMTNSCELVISDEEVTIVLPDRTASIPAGTIDCIGVTVTHTGRRGVFVHAIEDGDICVLLAPSETDWDESKGEQLIDSIQRDLSSIAPRARLKLSSGELKAAAILWDPLVQNNPEASQ